MLKARVSRVLGGAISGVLLLSTACTGPPVTVAPAVPAQHEPERVGPAQGSACGAHLFDVIPIGLNGRVGKAYARALRSAPGSKALVGVVLEERWFYWVFGTSRCTKVSGMGVR